MKNFDDVDLGIFAIVGIAFIGCTTVLIALVKDVNISDMTIISGFLTTAIATIATLAGRKSKKGESENE